MSEKNISDKYLDALKLISTWVTVSEWTIKFCEIYPELLEKANKEAANQKNETTGLREMRLELVPIFLGVLTPEKLRSTSQSVQER